VDDWLTLIYQNRYLITAALFIGWILYALHRTGKLRIKPTEPTIARRFPVPLPLEQRVAETETNVERLARENERLTLALARLKEKEIKREIVSQTEKMLKKIIPEEQFLLDPRQQLIGRPVYYAGGIPVIDKEEILEQIAQKFRIYRLAPFLTTRIIDRLYFDGDTLYYWDTRLLPNGSWAIICTSKRPKLRGNKLKLKRFSIPYILLTPQRERIDDLILNKWEATTFHAALILSSTILGPFPLEEYAKLQSQTGWGE